jgi:parvulin-like peptidyl-prolyl isomerase
MPVRPGLFLLRPPAWCGSALAVAALAVAAGDGPSRADDPPPAVVARVGDAPVLQSAFDAVIRRLGPQQTITADRRRHVEAAVMEQLVDEVLIRSELEHRQIAVADSEIDTALGQFKAQFNGDASYQAFLAATGRDEAGLRDQLRLNIGMEKYARPLMTPPALDAVFQAQRREVDGTRLRVSHILLRPDILDVSGVGGGDGIDRIVMRAESIRSDILQDRTTFEDAARRHSAAPSRHRGGDMGWINRDGPMVEEFSRPVYRLAKGEVSRPIITPFGVHIVKVTDVDPGRIGIDVVRPRIEKVLFADLVRRLVQDARRRLPVAYSPGVAHFDPATPADAAGPRRIVVAGSETPAN